MSAFLSKNVPLIAQLKGYTGALFKDDMLGGLTTAIMLIPQGMAYAMLAGLDPIVGLYASTIPLVLYALLGTSRQLAIGPAAMVSLLVASGVSPLVPEGDTASFLLHATVLAGMVGLIQLAMGAIRLGFLVKFLSQPVISGFSSAAAIIIGLSQLKHMMGVDIRRSHYIHELILEAVEQADHTNHWALGIALVSVVTLVTLKRFAPRFPRFLLVVIAGTVVVWSMNIDVSIVGDVPAGLPAPSMPRLSLETLQEMLPIAITIALISFIQSISMAKAFARKNGYEVDPNRELMGLGMANIGAFFVQGLPISGGFSRTAVNAQAGAKTGLASIITGLLIVITLLFLTPLFRFLPKAVLAAIIMTAVAGLVDFKEAKHLWHVDRGDLALMGLTFIATLVLGIEDGIIVGVVASLARFVWLTSSPHVAVLGRISGTNIYRNLDRNPEAQTTPGVLALRIDAPLYFANSLFLKQTLRQLESEQAQPLEHLVLDAKSIGSIDSSGLNALEEVIADLHSRDIQVWFAGVRGPVMDRFKCAKIGEEVDATHFVERVHQAVDAARHDSAQEQMTTA